MTGLDGWELAYSGKVRDLYVPAGTPQEIVDALNSALVAALADEEVISRLGELGTAPVAADRATPDAHREHLQAQIDRVATQGPRGRQGSPGRVVLPERWLDDPDDPSVPFGAELEYSGG